VSDDYADDKIMMSIRCRWDFLVCGWNFWGKSLRKKMQNWKF